MRIHRLLLLVAPLALAGACDLAAGLDGYTFAEPRGGAGGEAGAGGAIAECQADADCPQPEGDCFLPRCEQSTCTQQPAPSSTPCDEAGGDACDASGACRKGNGKGCAADVECVSNACVDDTCCQSACDGVCVRCDDPADPGICAPDPVGSSCNDGLCDGTDSGLCHDGVHRFSGAWGDPMTQRALAIAFDPQGSAWIGGNFEGTVDLGAGAVSADQIDAFLLKLDDTGAYQSALSWTNAGYQSVNAVAADGQGHVLAAGTYGGDAAFGDSAFDNGGSLSAFLLAFDEAGAILWQKDFLETNQEQQGTDVAVVPVTDDVVMAGYFKGTLGGLVAPTDRFDIFAMRFGSDGTLQWERRWGSPDEAQTTEGLDVDAAGNVYLTGQLGGEIAFGPTTLQNTSGTLDAFVAKLDPAGAAVWSQKLASPEELVPTDVAVAPDGRVVVVGHFMDSLTVGGTTVTSASPIQTDAFVAVFMPDGTLELLKRYGDAAAGQMVQAVAVDAHGNLALTGRFASQLAFDGLMLQGSSLVANDIFAVLLAPDTTPLWGKVFGGPTASDGGQDVAFSPASDLGLVGALRSTASFGGMSFTSAGEADAFVACFAP